MPRRKLTGIMTANEQIDDNTMESAMSGDLTMVITPTTVTTDETSAAWTRTVNVAVKNTAGDVHTWLNQDYATTASIADTSSAGEAEIESTTLSLVNGETDIVITGTEAAWLGGTQQEESITVTNGVDTADGTLVFTVTADGMDNSPKAVNVAVTDPSTVDETAAAIGAALETDEDVSGFFTVTDATIKLTALAAAANDATMAMALTDADGTGVTVGSSGDTTAGVAPETDTLTIGNITVMGYTVTGGTSVETFSL
jgi:hypothetical protein